MDKQTVIEGFAFINEKAALKARHEAESIRYLKTQINMDNPRIVLEFYRKLLAEEVFETPVGLIFLKELYDRLAPVPEFRQKLSPIPAEKMAGLLSAENALPSADAGASATEGQPSAGAGASAAEGQPSAGADVSISQGQEIQADFRQAEEMAVLYEEKLEQAKQKVRATERKQRQAEKEMRKKKSSLRMSLAVNFFLLLVAAGMVAIALLDSTPNIINYENKIQDKYAQWEMDLKEREAKVKEKERELHLE